MSYPPPGYPPQGPGYPLYPLQQPQIQMPYPGQPYYPPTQQPGYPPYPGSTAPYPQPSYPTAHYAQPGYQAQAPGYPPAQPAAPYPSQGPQAGYPSAPGYPTQTTYPPQLGYPYPGAQPGYPSAAQPGYPPQQPGYPMAPPQQQAPGYPSGAQQSNFYYQSQTTAAMSGDIYAPTVLPDPHFNAQKDCEVLRKAMKGIGTDEAALIAVLCKRSWQQRNEIERTYKQMFGKDLEKEVKGETGGNFHKVLERLLKTPVELAAYELHNAIAGVGTDEECLVEVVCTKSNQELQAVQQKYREMYGKSLEKDISGDTSGYFRRLLISLLSCNRPLDSPPDWAAAAADARALYEAGQKKVGTDEARFNAVLCGRSFSQLRAIFDCYAREYKTDIHDVIKSEFSGDISSALLAVVGAIRNRTAYFAGRLRAAMAGAGTRDEMLLRIIVSRCDFDLGAIKAEYQRMFGKTLSKAVDEETSGDYKRSLLALIG